MEAIILDTETTDKDEGEVIELAWAEVSFKTDLIDDALTMFLPDVSRFSPTKPSKFGALAVHHILPEELEGHSPASEARMPSTQYVIGHNIDFDWKALGCPPVKRICTLALARSLWPECDSHTQTALMYFLFGQTQAVREQLKSAHSAGADIEMCFRVLARIVEKTGATSWPQLWQISEDARIPKIMTFGKFKDMPISAVDRGYSNWYRRQPDTDPYLLEAFRRAGI